MSIFRRRRRRRKSRLESFLDGLVDMFDIFD